MSQGRCKDTTLFSNNKAFKKKRIASITEMRFFISNLTACLVCSTKSNALPHSEPGPV